MHGQATLVINGLVPFKTDTKEDMEQMIRDYVMSYLEGVGKRRDMC
jgi:hypothetical protein